MSRFNGFFDPAAGLWIDAGGLAGLGHECRPERCVERSCCAEFEPFIEPDEIERVVGYLPLAARWVPDLEADDNIFDDERSGALIIEESEEGFCRLAFRDGRGGPRCALHAAALELRADPYRIKPRACVLWPLALSGDDPPILSVQTDAPAFPCNRARPPKPPLDPNVAAIVAAVFGRDLTDRIESFLAQP